MQHQSKLNLFTYLHEDGEPELITDKPKDGEETTKKDIETTKKDIETTKKDIERNKKDVETTKKNIGKYPVVRINN